MVSNLNNSWHTHHFISRVSAPSNFNGLVFYNWRHF